MKYTDCSSHGCAWLPGAHLALCGPTLACSKEEEACSCWSVIAPDSRPRGPMQVAERRHGLVKRLLSLDNQNIKRKLKCP